MWYTLLGAGVAILVAVILSISTARSSVRYTDPKLLSPIIRRFLVEEKKSTDVVNKLILIY